MTLSKHGERRTRERVGVNKKSAQRQFDLALKRGYQLHELSGRLHKWTTSKVFATGKPHKCIIYNNNCFVVGPKNTLITVLPIPGNLHKEVSKLKKKES